MVQVAGGGHWKGTVWDYQIYNYKSDTFTRKLDDMMEDIPKEGPEHEGSND